VSNKKFITNCLIFEARKNLIGNVDTFSVFFVFANLWRIRMKPGDQNRANVIHVFKKKGKEKPRSYCPVSLMSTAIAFLEQIIKKVFISTLKITAR